MGYLGKPTIQFIFKSFNVFFFYEFTALFLSVFVFLYVRHFNNSKNKILYNIILIIKVTLSKYFIDILQL